MNATPRPLVQLTDEELGSFGRLLKHIIGDDHHLVCRDCLIFGMEAYDDHKKERRAVNKYDELVKALMRVLQRQDQGIPLTDKDVAMIEAAICDHRGDCTHIEAK